MTEFSVYSILNGYDHDRVCEHYATTRDCDPGDVSRITSLGDLQLAMGDRPEVTTAHAESMRDVLIERDLLDWISDVDGGICWATEEEFLSAIDAACFWAT